MKLRIASTLGLAVLADFSFLSPATAVVTIDYVSVGNVKNVADPR